jgi:hypothetical protein
MSFDLAWVNDPYTDSNVSDPPSYFGANHFAMAALRSEMHRQGMLDHGRIPEHKLCFNDGEVVTPTEIRAAVLVASRDPAPPDHEADDPTLRVLVDKLEAQGHDVSVPGQHALATIPMERWVTRWRDFLAFMEGAAEHGGFEVW